MKQDGIRIQVTLNPQKKYSSSSKTTENANRFIITLLKEDLTIQETNAIVNAANESLWLGGGVAGAIRMKGGYEIEDECQDIVRIDNKKKPLDNGDVAYTNIGKFKNKNLKYIFHAVGPVYRNGMRNEKAELTNCFLNCFKLADQLKLNSIAIPPVSTGIFGYPKIEGAEVFYDCVERYFKEFLNANEIQKGKEEREETFSLFSETKSEKIVEEEVKHDINFNFDSQDFRNQRANNEDNNLDFNINQISFSTLNLKMQNDQNSQNETKVINIPSIRTNETQTFIDNNEAPKYNNAKISFFHQTCKLDKLHLNGDKQLDWIDIGDSSKKEKTESSEGKVFYKDLNDPSTQSSSQFYDNNEKFDFERKQIANAQATGDNQNIKKKENNDSRIIRCIYDKDSKINLENNTLEEIKMVIIDRATFEVFEDIFRKKLSIWLKNDNYRIEQLNIE